MKLKFEFDAKTLREFRRKADALQRSLLDDVTHQLAEETVSLIRETFDAGASPDGEKWERPKFRSGRPLQDTGGLKASWFVKSRGRGSFTVANAKEYASFLQEGTGLYGPRRQRIKPKTKRALAWKSGGATHVYASVAGIKPRRMLPTKGLPPLWAARYREVATEVFNKIAKGRGRFR